MVCRTVEGTRIEVIITEAANQPVTAPAHVPLTPEQLDRLKQVGAAYRALRRSAAVAAFSGMTTLAIGTLSLTCLFLDPGLVGFAVAFALCGFGAIELIGRQRLLQGTEDSLRILTWNQLAFFAAVAIYCGVQMATFSVQSLISPETRSVLGELPGASGGNLFDPQTEKSLKLAYIAVYALIILVSLASQGGLALYYARRRKHLDLFRSASDWEKQLLLQISP